MATTTEGGLVPAISPQSKPRDQSTTVPHSTAPPQGPTWLHTQLRNLIALVLTGLVCWLALTGIQEAMTALIAAFSLLMGALWGERAALKIPGQDT